MHEVTQGWLARRDWQVIELPRAHRRGPWAWIGVTTGILLVAYVALFVVPARSTEANRERMRALRADPAASTTPVESSLVSEEMVQPCRGDDSDSENSGWFVRRFRSNGATSEVLRQFDSAVIGAGWQRVSLSGQSEVADGTGRYRRSIDSWIAMLTIRSNIESRPRPLDAGRWNLIVELRAPSATRCLGVLG